ncbi:hypothetical protein CLV63_101182 [Murinocardiopsis flavida]|uniref:Uncharacterized protein n=1 Tax=Murinocardiopsis flavida TaxID=645275 RepID=A0A2P8DU13_9ACTN|nr:hypothetical protein [Murinocardiopsis flavida]PSL00708.1 hypothetical protein CLV63_101182 [Murinocardiopsis flavida]
MHSSVWTTAGLVGGYLTARVTGIRPLGGAVLAGCGAAAYREWQRSAGTGTAAALTGCYLVAFGLSHPLAKRLGPWPAVLSVSAATAAAAHAFADGRGSGAE